MLRIKPKIRSQKLPPKKNCGYSALNGRARHSVRAVRRFLADRMRCHCRRQYEEQPEIHPYKIGWRLGSEEFRQELLAQVAEAARPWHEDPEVRESSLAKAERVVDEELRRMGWTPPHLEALPTPIRASNRAGWRGAARRRVRPSSRGWNIRRAGIEEITCHVATIGLHSCHEQNGDDSHAH